MVELWNDYGWPLFLIVAQSVAMIVVLLVIIAFLLYADRKVWAAVQMRRGPNVVGPFGLWQSFADLFKFVFKEPIIPAAPTSCSSCSRRSLPPASPYRPGQ
ncbi:NADH-quinone oxidoreductase subunit H [Methyloligella halotolerans]|uniref:NADH-quinone oxidoreductase subunit H n=1 Tax=Methyloligella halotolerans TaxID=1177755 RepID=A0A1E2S244_9HYPH|nr:NADH-quinone oxidoreductase subunit H [Methyloligella halotolerans]